MTTHFSCGRKFYQYFQGTYQYSFAVVACHRKAEVEPEDIAQLETRFGSRLIPLYLQSCAAIEVIVIILVRFWRKSQSIHGTFGGRDGKAIILPFQLLH